MEVASGLTHAEARSAAPPAARSAVTTQEVRVHVSKRGSTLGANANAGTNAGRTGPSAVAPPTERTREQKEYAMEGILHSVNSFHTIYRPVVITMLIISS